jgi:AcrR family transcriptional regulator
MKLADKLAEQRRQDALAQIAQTALELFMQDGFEATSVEAIAAAAGCSPRTFYRYFGTKEDVMFHDLPSLIAQLGDALDEHLARGLGPWAAVSELYEELIARFDRTDGEFLTHRQNLWLSEPALRSRYMQFVHEAEQVIADTLHRHLGTMPERDDLPGLIAVAATGAYRVTLHTHAPAGAKARGKLAKHLKVALATLGNGLAIAPAPPRRSTRRRA